MLVCVHLLNTEHNISPDVRAVTFNAIYLAELAAMGLPNGTSKGCLTSQYAMRRRLNEAHAWRSVLAAPTTAGEEALRDEIRSSIADALALSQTQVATPSTPARARPQDPSTPPLSSIKSRTRKRAAPSAHTASDGPGTGVDEDGFESLPSKRTRRPTQKVSTAVPITPESATRSRTGNRLNLSPFQHAAVEPRTPHLASQQSMSPNSQTSNLQKKKARPGADHQYARSGRTTVHLTAAEMAHTKPNLVSVVERLGKPQLPPLLFRYFDIESHGINMPDTPEGFICGRFKDSYVDVRPAPLNADIEWNDMAWHLDHTPNSSPYVSMSNSGVWVVRKAMISARTPRKDGEEGSKGGRISVIDTSFLQASNVYWVPPFHKSLSMKKPFHKGGFNYMGSHEHVSLL
jgi:hypothetical protein